MSACTCSNSATGHDDHCMKVACGLCQHRAPGPKPCEGCWDADEIIEHYKDRHEQVRRVLSNMEAEVQNNVRREAHDVLLVLVGHVRELLGDE